MKKAKFGFERFKSNGIFSKLREVFILSTMDSIVIEGPQNIEVIGAVLLVYCYTFSKSSDLWKVLFVMGVSALCGNFIQALYDTLRSKGYDNPLLSILLIFNEIFWL